jgi:O-acetyl-ADP-ribose deacetylase (regulator of RNase III)
MVEMKDGDLIKAKVDIIAHQVNCQGKMSSGLAKDLRGIYRDLLKQYNKFCKHYGFSESMMGIVQVVEAERYGGRKDLVANLFAQYEESSNGEKMTDYRSLKQSLILLREYCETLSFSKSDDVWTIGVPYKLGCGCGGGDWNVVSKMLHDIFDDSQNIKLIIFRKNDELQEKESTDNE